MGQLGDALGWRLHGWSLSLVPLLVPILGNDHISLQLEVEWVSEVDSRARFVSSIASPRLVVVLSQRQRSLDRLPLVVRLVGLVVRAGLCRGNITALERRAASHRHRSFSLVLVQKSTERELLSLTQVLVEIVDQLGVGSKTLLGLLKFLLEGTGHILQLTNVVLFVFNTLLKCNDLILKLFLPLLVRRSFVFSFFEFLLEVFLVSLARFIFIFILLALFLLFG